MSSGKALEWQVGFIHDISEILKVNFVDFSLSVKWVLVKFGKENKRINAKVYILKGEKKPKIYTLKSPAKLFVDSISFFEVWRLLKKKKKKEKFKIGKFIGSQRFISVKLKKK